MSVAEFCGILFGDGKITPSKEKGYRIAIWFNMVEREYMKEVKTLVIKHFQITPSLYFNLDKSVYCMQFFSKELVLRLLSLGVPTNHKNDMVIPLWILKDESAVRDYLRGLFDTDGCITYQRDKGYIYPLIKFTMKSKKFAFSVRNALQSLGLRAYTCKKGRTGFDVVIRNKESINYWITNIGCRNATKREKVRGINPLSGDTGI